MTYINSGGVEVSLLYKNEAARGVGGGRGRQSAGAAALAPATRASPPDRSAPRPSPLVPVRARSPHDTTTKHCHS